MTTNGTDISAFQPGSPNIGSNTFGFVKATEGCGWVSPVWRAQAQAFRNARDGVGYYHFCNGNNSPQAEAQYFWNTIKGFWQVGEPIALDVEGAFFSTVADPVGWTLACAQELKRLSGLIPVFYSDWSHIKGQWNWQPLVDFNMGLWGAAYNSVGFGDPSPWPAIFVWQDSDHDESSGGDDDVLYGDLNTWRAYGTPAGITPDSNNVTPIGDDVSYSQWTPEDKAALFHDIWFGCPGAPLIIDRETNQGAWPETHLASLRQRLDASLGSAIGAVASAVKAAPAPQPATGPGALTQADIDAIAAAVFALYKQHIDK